ncbi:hypothetical protein MferCBS31731_002279 [Microsporum ferrugineum]
MLSSLLSLAIDTRRPWSPRGSTTPVVNATLTISAGSATEDSYLVENLISFTLSLSRIIREIDDGNKRVSKRKVQLSPNLLAASKCLGSNMIVTPNVRKLWGNLLQKILWIVTWPASSKGPGLKTKADPFETMRVIKSSLQGDVVPKITAFLEEGQSFMVDHITAACQSIVNELADSDESAVQVDDDVISQKAVKDLLTAIWKCSACDSCEKAATHTAGHITRFHPTRLFLGRPRRTRNSSALYDVFMSSSSLQYWQEIGVILPQKKVRFSGEVQASPPEKEKVSGFCNALCAENHARILLELRDQGLFRYEDVGVLHHEAISGRGIPLLSVLREYHLDISEKIVLSHAIAREFWQFYETKMMLMKWSSDSIWFMSKKGDPNAPLPTKAYIYFPFEHAEYELEEYSAVGLIYKYPRIFSLAILLLEISLGRPIQTSQHKRHDSGFVGGMNKDFYTASNLLDELKGQSWTNWLGKRDLDLAIEACLTSSNFAPSLQDPSSPMGPSERREVFYEKVVQPLQWLADSLSSVTYFEKRNSLGSSDSSVGASPAQIKELCPSTFASFHSGKIVNPKKWLDDLNRIGIYIKQLKQRPVNTKVKPIRVAILDSGCSLEASFFKDGDARRGCIKTYKDFVDQSKEMKDSFGHGTFMAALVIKAAPTAELYVARIAENTEELDGSEGRIGEAIIWAGIEQKVDIISMSFGVSGDNGDINDAILKVRYERNDNVIFLASAGNSGPHQDIAFPASHRDVIPIRSTNYMGASSDTNPAPDRHEQAPLFATFGDNIPPLLQEYKPEVCGPGSSVSTAVAAGIAASILSYCACLEKMYPGLLGDRQLTKLRTVKGMEELFSTMSKDMGNRIWFINPVKFFTERKTNISRCNAIVECICNVR